MCLHSSLNENDFLRIMYCKFTYQVLKQFENDYKAGDCWCRCSLIGRRMSLALNSGSQCVGHVHFEVAYQNFNYDSQSSRKLQL